VVEIYVSFGGTYFVVRIESKAKELSSKKRKLKLTQFTAFLGFLFDHEDGSSKFVRNIGEFLSECNASHARRLAGLFIESFKTSPRILVSAIRL
jgi:hypothetical protein